MLKNGFTFTGKKTTKGRDYLYARKGGFFRGAGPYRIAEPYLMSLTPWKEPEQAAPRGADEMAPAAKRERALEEGLHVPDVDLVIFFEAVPSEIRSIQRRGRTGRTRPGRVAVLLAEGTIDEAYYQSCLDREESMRTVVSGEGRSSKIPGPATVH